MSLVLVKLQKELKLESNQSSVGNNTINYDVTKQDQDYEFSIEAGTGDVYNKSNVVKGLYVIVVYIT